MLSGSFCLKKEKKIVCYFEKITSSKFNKKLVNFTFKKIKLINHNKIKKKIKITTNHLKFIKNKISKNKSKLDHKILISNESQKKDKICINIKNNNVSLYNKAKLPFNSHYFILQDNEFNQWISKKITFEEVLGTRRFTYERYPNKYDVKVNSIYTNFL